MKHVGLCSVLIACCLSAPAWAVRYGENEAPESTVSVSNPEVPVQVPDEEAYAPWQVYGYTGYDQSAIAKYNAWPQVCTDGLWDNFCNEQHCHCYKGPKQRCHHGAHFQQGCNSCQNFAGSHLKHGHRMRNFAASFQNTNGCVDGNCNGELAESVIDEGPALEIQPVPEPEIEPASPSDRTIETSVQQYPRTNPIRQPLIPARWKSQN